MKVFESVESLEEIEEENEFYECSEIFNLLREDITLDSAIEIKKSLQSASEDWLNSFLLIDGMKQLVNTLTFINCIPDKNVENHRIQYELIRAIKAAMQIQRGLEDLVNQPELVALIALNIDCEDAAICAQVNIIFAIITLK